MGGVLKYSVACRECPTFSAEVPADEVGEVAESHRKGHGIEAGAEGDPVTARAVDEA